MSAHIDTNYGGNIHGRGPSPDSIKVHPDDVITTVVLRGRIFGAAHSIVNHHRRSSNKKCSVTVGQLVI